MRYLVFSIALIAHIFPVTSTAADGDWQKYENSHFTAYSNGSEEHVAKILGSLEQFRTAAIQIPTFVIPVGRPKTLVILPATHEEFLTFAHYESVAGFAATLAGRATIVMPAGDPDINLRVVVGHEFAHTLLFNDYFNYPSWYAEGFAEIASSIVVDDNNNTFTIGARNDLRKRAAKPRIEWDDLIDSGFNAHTFGDTDRTASAYAQDWLLVHYLTLNESADYSSELNRYFASINNGIPSAVAFQDSFGKAVADFWRSDLKAYLKQIQSSVFSFAPEMQDLDFQSSTADEEVLRPILKYLKDYADIRHGRNAPAEPTAHLPGKWDWFRLDDQCSEPITVRFRNDGILVLESFYSDDDTDPVPALFDIYSNENGALELTNVTSIEFPQVRFGSDYRALMKSENVMCFDTQPDARECLRILHRCD